MKRIKKIERDIDKIFHIDKSLKQSDGDKLQYLDVRFQFYGKE